MDTTNPESAEEISYKKGRRIGTIFGATVTLIILSLAYIVSQGILYWK